MTDNSLVTIEIDLEAISHNLAEIRRLVGKEVEVMPVVKADAYGTGAVPVSKICVREGVKTLVVSSLSEAVSLREEGIDCKIVVLFGASEGEEEYFVKYRLTPVLYTTEAINRLGEKLRYLKEKLPIHIIIDTGMGRIGFLPKMEEEILDTLKNNPELQLEGIMTHFSSAYEKDKNFTLGQIDRFKRLMIDIEKSVFKKPFIHVANSAGLLNYKESLFNGVRPGIILYGARPSEDEISADIDIKPVMSLKTRLVQIRNIKAGSPIGYSRTFTTKRDSIIGTIPVGYANGYSRALSNKAQVLVRGKRVPQVGTVCMDISMIDLTDIPEAALGDEVVLFGRQGEGYISVDEVAGWGDTIPYEFLCQAGKNSNKIYI
jgi:alanine racemase